MEGLWKKAKNKLYLFSLFWLPYAWFLPAYMAINKALDFVAHDTTLRPVPLHLRNAPTKLMSEAGYGKGYKYAHDYVGGFIEQEFMPEALVGKAFYEPNTQNATEVKIAERMESLWGEKYKMKDER